MYLLVQKEPDACVLPYCNGHPKTSDAEGPALLLITHQHVYAAATARPGPDREMKGKQEHRFQRTRNIQIGHVHMSATYEAASENSQSSSRTAGALAPRRKLLNERSQRSMGKLNGNRSTDFYGFIASLPAPAIEKRPQRAFHVPASVICWRALPRQFPHSPLRTHPCMQIAQNGEAGSDHRC